MLKLLYWIEVPIFFFPISFGIFLFSILSIDFFDFWYLFILVIVFEYFLTVRVLKNCSVGSVGDIISVLFCGFAIIFVCFLMYIRFINVNIIGFICVMICILFHLLAKGGQMWVHSGKFIDQRYVVSKFKFGRLFDWRIPQKMDFAARLMLIFHILFVSMLLVISIFPIMFFNTEYSDVLEINLEYVIFVISTIFLSFLYYSSVSYLMVLRGSADNYLSAS